MPPFLRAAQVIALLHPDTKSTKMSCRHYMLRICILILGFTTALTMTACDDRERLVQIPGANALIKPIDLAESEIKAGWGIEYCHIGMKIEECVRLFGDPDVRIDDADEFADGRMSWYGLGLMVAFKDETVVQVYFDYLSEKFSPFQGEVYSDDGNASPMSAIVARFGEPTENHKVRISSWLPPADKEFFEQNFAGKMRTMYDYPSLGIDITFVEDRLECVRVYKSLEEQDRMKERW